MKHVFFFPARDTRIVQFDEIDPRDEERHHDRSTGGGETQSTL